MSKNVFRLALCAMLLAICDPVHAQQAKERRIAVIGAPEEPRFSEVVMGLKNGLGELGYAKPPLVVQEVKIARSEEKGTKSVVEGLLRQQVQVLFLRELAAELVHLKVEAIVTAGPTATRPAKEATKTIPIVMGFDSDPVGSGVVYSLARPGGNITGLSTLAPELSGKQLELLKEIVPKLSRVAVFGTSTRLGNAQAFREIELAAGALKVKLQYLDILDPKDIETAFRAAGKESADAVLTLSSAILDSHRTQVADLAAKSRLPAIYPQTEYMDAGGLMFYGPSITDSFRRAATYVDKILKGAKPTELPVEQPTKFELVINLKAAKQIGLTIPPNVLARADKVIK